MLDRYIEKILTARVYDVAEETPLDRAVTLSQRLDNKIFLKREDEQPVFSFKCRGAYNSIYQRHRREPLKGVIAASAGNHAQGVALAARHLGIPGVIVMPCTTPAIKVDAVRRLGGEAVLHGDNYDEAFAHACEIQAEKGYSFIHPFDDPDTIAGQGTVGMEISRQHPDDVDAVFVPIGGGGLAAGVSVYLKYLRPDIRVIGVEPVDAASMSASLKAGHRVTLDQVGIFADGVAVKQVGEETFRLCQQYLDDVVTVSVDEICAAVKDVFDDTRTLMEPSGALSVAGLKKYVAEQGCSGKTMIAVTSGANVNFDRLRHIAERAELGEQREMLMAVEIPEKPGSFRAFCDSLPHRSITEFNYRYVSEQRAQIFVGLQLSEGNQERLKTLAELRDRGYKVLDMTDNEVAKLHVRYMVGGQAGGISDERLFRFEFPERPGALGAFLNGLSDRWNISLFHYRNHGAAFGRVMVGIQVPESDNDAFVDFLQAMGYSYREETENPAYQYFLTNQ